eukprot:CAMPEP_0206499552 /NCGR_PEP_ID=MMETSP0324_2-20121206/51803_1 /ASSEMBLY_ACC=CAM_ASM_000836 /TAXON_ID=2866 /ORGANISM="Crypthecodinium cohnii, Strain Seligo" /LENGTH=186 /DNA_ID=CAMNT_0053986243 /DNA_START=100 /DNA_END=657 /DNA_ORIENTATION=-
MAISRGSCVLIGEPFNDYPDEGSGYLCLQRGQQVIVEWADQSDPENRGWLYGCLADQTGIKGWFPDRIIYRQATPVKAPPPAKGPPATAHQPTLLIPSQVQHELGIATQQQPQTQDAAQTYHQLAPPPMQQPQVYPQVQQPVQQAVPLSPAAPSPYPYDQHHMQRYLQEQYQQQQDYQQQQQQQQQ